MMNEIYGAGKQGLDEQLAKKIAQDTIAAGNIAKRGTRLDLVVMPLVAVMNSGDLSWSQRMEVADAIRSAVSAWRSLEDVRRMFDQKAMQVTEQKVAGNVMDGRIGPRSE